MPQSLSLSTPPQGSIKRQRSQEMPVNVSRPASRGQGQSNGLVGKPDDSAKQMNVKIPAYLNKTRAKISSAFQELEWKQRYRLQHASQNPHTSPFRIDRSLAVISRNRYGNVQPWESSRVKLKKPIGGSDYVNASPITLKSRLAKRPCSGSSTPASTGQPLLPSITPIESKYIATQGPKEGQFSHFWHMVMQETPGEVGVIIMLTQLYEGNKEKCAQYFPPDMDNPTIILPAHEDGNDDGETEAVDDGDPFLDSPAISAETDRVGTDAEDPQSEPPGGPEEQRQEAPAQEQGQCGSVSLLSLHYEAKIGCEVRKLRLTIDGESKSIYHYLFHGWPDFGKPEAEDRKALLELTKVSRTVAGDSPRIVHCSAGVGRTGTWIALDFLLQELESGRLVDCSPPQTGTHTPTTNSNGTSTWGRSGPPKESTPDPKDDEDLIWETVNTLREQRMMMVMNELQYSFLYEALKEAFIEKYAEKETGPVVIEVQEPSPKVARKRSPFGGMFRGGRVGTVKGDEDTVSADGVDESESEAETEIMEKEKAGVDVDMDEAVTAGPAEDVEGQAGKEGEADEDPYAAVAPETIREGQENKEQNVVREHEVK
ncbi:uncharacterized protein Z519_00469 [Cladophialophora bantiana CBS 173.52]|uniref:Protein-tyrosine phosphatase n=1 Tax=Cladophialophora bantiana (strain ATCC 10958 / CBS 173.52 / CDC B-1940 / NIH 8579) TaxID=1442370 RepID=A0A0D2F9P8_CLAB1|nr:uncharacterized protein Z519_00469 [Cladophialophora bantiana CBS 173.52]KIW98806.1 hypothetical protein Z519_00469 [Cladophialophora bantiana CBS 173.52]